MVRHVGVAPRIESRLAGVGAALSQAVDFGFTQPGRRRWADALVGEDAPLAERSPASIAMRCGAGATGAPSLRKQKRPPIPSTPCRRPRKPSTPPPPSGGRLRHGEFAGA